MLDASALRTLIDHALIGEMINKMRWFVRIIEGPVEFLTSDRPLITWYEFAAHGSYIILLIGLKSALVAVNNEKTQCRIEARVADEWVTGLNRSIAGTTNKFVFARDDGMENLIVQHSRAKARTTLVE